MLQLLHIILLGNLDRKRRAVYSYPFYQGYQYFVDDGQEENNEDNGKFNKKLDKVRN